MSKKEKTSNFLEPSHCLWEKDHLSKHSSKPCNVVECSETSVLTRPSTTDYVNHFLTPIPPPTYFHPGSQAPSQSTKKTAIHAHVDVGFGNCLFLRGTGPGLSWDKGIPLENTNANEWLWKSESNCSCFEFKTLINDERFEIGENHKVQFGESIEYTPQF